jgi:predicted RNase H-like nuclease (RuvC/YqgF family)
MAPPNAKFMSVEEMIEAMDADNSGGVDVDEWLQNLAKCAGLAAALAESVNDSGVVEKFRSFEQQKAKREKEIAELESKLVTASPEEMEKLTQEMQEYERQVESLAKKIEEAAANAAARAAA